MRRENDLTRCLLPWQKTEAGSPYDRVYMVNVSPPEAAPIRLFMWRGASLIWHWYVTDADLTVRAQSIGGWWHAHDCELALMPLITALLGYDLSAQGAQGAAQGAQLGAQLSMHAVNGCFWDLWLGFAEDVPIWRLQLIRGVAGRAQEIFTCYQSLEVVALIIAHHTLYPVRVSNIRPNLRAVMCEILLQCGIVSFYVSDDEIAFNSDTVFSEQLD